MHVLARVDFGRRAWLAPGLLLGCFLLSCATGGDSLPPHLFGVPDPNDPFDARLVAARRLLEKGQPLAARAEVEAALLERPGHAGAERLRQDCLRNRGRMGLLLHESELRLERSPDSAEALYLRARILRDGPEKTALFEQAVLRDPASFWAWLGLAYSLRGEDSARARGIYLQLLARSSEHPLVLNAFLGALAGSPSPQTLPLCERLRQRGDEPGLGSLRLAEALVEGGRLREAWPALLEALKGRPYDPDVRQLVNRFLQNGMPDEELVLLSDLLRADPARLEMFRGEGGELALAALALKLGNPLGARRVLEGESGDGPRDAQARRVWRRILLATGDVGRFLADLRATFPRHLLEDEKNQVRGLWVELFQGPWAGVPDPLLDPRHGKGLCAMLMRCGMLREASLLLDAWHLRHRSADPDLRAEAHALQAEVQRELAFEGAMQRIIYHGYKSAAAPRALEEVLEDLRRVSREFLGEDVVGTPPMRSVSLVGMLLDPFHGTFAEHLARYNRHLLLGQRPGRPTEGLILTRLSVADLEPHPLLPLPARCFEVVGENREIRTLSGVYGGDLAGVALFDHYVIDYDSVREWADNLREHRRIAREDGQELLRDPLPKRATPLQAADVDWRLDLLSPEQDTELDAAVFDMIRWHERAHLVDSYYFLPPLSNLKRVAGLLLRNFFSAAGVEGELEGRAELAALAVSPHTRLVLAHIASFLEGNERESAHVRGFRRLAERVHAKLTELGVKEPRAVEWYLLDPALVRSVATELLREQW